MMMNEILVKYEGWCALGSLLNDREKAEMIFKAKRYNRLVAVVQLPENGAVCSAREFRGGCALVAG